MSNEGERPVEPTSYDLQPPVPTTGHVPTQLSAEPGDVRRVGGRYRLMGRLGHGGMGTVWRAFDEVVERDVAVKEPRPPEHLDEAGRASFFERLRREARAAAKIDHPSVVTVHDVVLDEGRPWIVMELVDGRSLGDVIAEGTLEEPEAARIGLAVLGALAAAHRRGVLHRDVKPDNVLLGAHDRVVLTDFGIARVEGERPLTETGAFVGSPEYVAPERALGQHPGPASDLWSLGVLLYTAVEGLSPFRRNGTPATLQAVLTAEPPAPSRAKGPLGALIMGLLRKEPAARPSVEELRAVLSDVAAGPARLPQLAGGPAGSGPAALLRRSRPARFAAMGGAALAVLALLLVLLDPFGAKEPDGWEQRTEKTVAATFEVPADFERRKGEADDGRGWLWFSSADGIYEIQVWLHPEAAEEPLRAAEEHLDDLKDNAWRHDLKDVSGNSYVKEYGELDGAEVSMTSRERRADDNAPRDQRLYFFHGGGGDRLWRVQVRLPAEPGTAHDEGMRIYERLLGSFRPQK
ncbi:serine/threonine-protein kinase [Streptomyces alkaliterrae]|uniref:non-specific serine/threonine protein kinase n=1 Tax=Streptomyces alkaliterrae TaxID=2213162 RepID=A0A5P0YXN5_9ACTN|nr:serine/threonine-protein kinase [Streptomyces alkaliterrae]MBB1261908.1 serine/threonine protein kinase [Streptomyces alkaliterrae]MQS04272.1 protein kinase [Streptomyces alkaliterrae]